MKPTWWLLYAIGLSLVGLLALVEIFVPRGGVQSVLEIIVVIGSFGLMALWLRHNRVAMELEEYDRRRGTVGRSRVASLCVRWPNQRKMFLYAILIIPYLAALGRRAFPARVRAPWRKA